jgi:hypothetical protein
MPFLLPDGAAWVIREALATHPVTRALALLDGLQPVQVTAPAAAVEQSPATAAEPAAVAAEAPATPEMASAQSRKARR